MPMSTPIYEVDVLIIGAGPAGCAVALSLLNYSSKSVIVTEMTDLSKLRIGEQVSASFTKFVDYLKLTPDEFNLDHCLPAVDSLSFWGSDQASKRHSVFTTEAESYQLNRADFDMALISKLSDMGARVFPRTKTCDIKALPGGGWDIGFMHEDHGSFRVRAGYLVDATGRAAHVTRKLGGVIKPQDKLVGLGQFLRRGDVDRSDKRVFGHVIEACELGWWYHAYLPDNRQVVTLFTDSDIASKMKLQTPQAWNTVLQKTRHIPAHVKRALAANDMAPPQKIWVRKANSQRTLPKTRPRFLAVGDAVCAFDPISSMGIGFGLTSACQAASLIADDRPEQSFAVYHDDIRGIFDNYLVTLDSIYQRERRWPEALFWKRRQQRLVQAS